MKILYVGYRDKNHSSAGGYDQIINNPGTAQLLGENVPFGFIPVGKRGKFLNLFFLNLYSRFLIKKYDVTHFFYGEMLKTYRRKPNNKIVATIHMRIDKGNKKSKKLLSNLSKADGVISLSSMQAKVLREEFGINAHFIPHGFNTPEFKYKNMITDNKKINIVVSGKNYRDTKTLYSIVEYCDIKRKDIIFHLLGQPIYVKDYLKAKSNVICYPRLNDDDYYSLIKDCDFNFLPLTYATANNALLEASFLGVKSIIPNIDGILDYAAPEPTSIFYSTNNDLINIFNSLQKKDYNEEDIISYARKFLWENVYNQLEKFYKTL